MKKIIRRFRQFFTDLRTLRGEEFPLAEVWDLDRVFLYKLFPVEGGFRWYLNGEPCGTHIFTYQEDALDSLDYYLFGQLIQKATRR